MWFRVAIDCDGAVTACEQVDASFDGGSGIFYVEADNKTAALAAAKAQYAMRAKARDRARLRKTCIDCGEESSGTRHCIKCREKSKERKRELRERRAKLGLARGEKLPAEYRRPAGNTGRRFTRAHVELLLLQRVKRVFAESTPAEFRAWLATEIGQRTNR